MNLPGSFHEGYRFALGMAIAGAQVDLIEAEVALEQDAKEADAEDSDGNVRYGEKRVWREQQVIERIEKLIEREMK